MLERIFRVAFPLCVASAILVCGSSRDSFADQQIRSQRHAACPSCHQDRPDAISDPWYSRGLAEPPTDFQGPNPPAQPFPRPYPSRPAVYGNPRESCGRPNPFSYPRVSPHVAPASATSVGPASLTQGPHQGTTQYRRPSFYDLINQRQQSNSEEETCAAGPRNPRMYSVVYRADRTSEEEEEDDESVGQVYQPNTPNQQLPRQPSLVSQARRDRSYDSGSPDMLHHPEMKYNLHHLPVEYIRMLLENLEAHRAQQSGNWKGDEESGEEVEDREVPEEIEVGEDGQNERSIIVEKNGMKEPQNVFDEGNRVGIANPTGEVAGVEASGNSTREDVAGVDPDLDEDIEGPPTESTENAAAILPTENSTASQ